MVKGKEKLDHQRGKAWRNSRSTLTNPVILSHKRGLWMLKTNFIGNISRKKRGSGIRQTWLKIPAAPLTSWVFLSK